MQGTGLADLPRLWICKHANARNGMVSMLTSGCWNHMEKDQHSRKAADERRPAIERANATLLLVVLHDLVVAVQEADKPARGTY